MNGIRAVGAFLSFWIGVVFAALLILGNSPQADPVKQAACAFLAALFGIIVPGALLLRR